MLAAGDRMPDATIWIAPREQATLAGLLADGPMLLLFYLFDWSGTWTNELELLRARGAEFTAAGVRTIGVSRDSPWSHVAWAHALDIEMPLLSDWNGEAVQAFDVGFEFRGMKDVAARSAFLVDAGGTVRGAWRYETDEVPDFDVLLAAAQAL